MIAPDDRGFTLGDGVFETVLAEAGSVVDLPAHLARMRRGSAALGLPAPDTAHVSCEVERAVGSSGERTAVRISWSAGPGGRGLDRPAEPAPLLAITTAPAPLQVGGARLAWSTVRRNAHSPTSRHKTLAYLDNVLARREARVAGADEALMLNTAGEVACAAAANVFWIAGGRLFTPALACGVLDGIVRAKVLAACESLGISTAEVRAGPGALDAADAVFLTNSLIGLRPAALAGPGTPHPTMLRLAQAVGLRSSPPRRSGAGGGSTST